MALTVYKRNSKWWIKGRINRLPASKYYRQSLGAPSTMPESEAKAIAWEFEQDEIKRALLGEQEVLTFEKAVLLYNPPPADAKFLLKIISVIGKELIKDIKPARVRQIAKELYPMASADTWQRQVVTPIRAVINNAHDHGKCPPIRIRGFTKAERLKQDKLRGKESRQAKVPGSWEWIEAFREHASPRIGALALFMFTTGARLTQSIEINDTSDLDLQNGRVLLPEAKGHEAQWIDLIPEVVADLANLETRNGRLFGYQYRYGVYKPWKKAVEKAGIEMILPHAAGRHGFGTELIVRQGLDAVTVAKEGRWATPTVPLNTYAHPSDSTKRVHDAFRTKPVQTKSRTGKNKSNIK